MKEIKIQIQIKVKDNQVLSAIYGEGIDIKTDMQDRLFLIGILENLKQTELSKLLTLKSASFSNNDK